MPPTKLRALPAESVNQLAHLLQTLPHERGLEYSERVTDTIPRLPSELKHRSRLSNFFSTNAPSPNVEAKLCLLHKPLSTSLIHEIFTLLSLEVGHHCNSMTQHNTWLSPGQNAAIRQLRELHSLWLPEQTYVQTFLESPNPKWTHQKSGCEGCILTRIGSDLQVVAELRALLLSRRRTVEARKSPPTLLKFVDRWLVGLVGEGERKREIMQGCEMEGEELKVVRKRIWRERRHTRRQARGKGVEPEIAEEKGEAKEKEEEEEALGQEAYDSDFESDIIDHYAALKSTLHQPSMKASMKASPAQVPSLTTGSSGQTLSSYVELETPPSDRLSKLPASSMYSFHRSNAVSTYEPPRRGQAWCGIPTASKQADDYRNLLAPPADEPLPRPKSVRKDDQGRGAKEYRNLLTPPAGGPLPRSKSVRKDDQGQEAKQHRNLLTPPAEEPLQRSKSVRKDDRQPMRDHRTVLTPTPQAPLPIPRWVKNEDKNWEARDSYTVLTPPPEHPLPRPKSVKEGEKKRQTTWSQFSSSHEYNLKLATRYARRSSHQPLALRFRKAKAEIQKKEREHGYTAQVTNVLERARGRQKRRSIQPHAVRKRPWPFLSPGVRPGERGQRVRIMFRA